MKSIRLIIKAGIILAFCAFVICGAIMRIGQRSAESFEVRGVDVSSYQGDIDWEILANEGISFAFIKATEGSSYVDRYFEENISEARRANVRSGAYHFFSFESGGKGQARNFIKTVPAYDDMLPPVIDLELYGAYKKNPPDAKEVRQNLDEIIEELSAHYKKLPIIYVTRKTYVLYVMGHYEDCDIWISGIGKKPTLPDGRRWTFWQYSHTGLLPGYNGDEEHIDLNVFSGTREQFLQYGL